MHAIHVKILAPTEKLPTRFKASGMQLCVVEPMQFDLSLEANAAYVAQQLVDNYNMSNPGKPLRIAGTGQLPDNTYAVLLQKLVK
jgi:hypothetical protein